MTPKWSKRVNFGVSRPGQKWEQNDPFLTLFYHFLAKNRTPFWPKVVSKGVQISRHTGTFGVKTGQDLFKKGSKMGQKGVKNGTPF